MATYRYEAINAAGQTIHEHLDAATAEDAVTAIRAKGYYPVKVQEKGARPRAQEKDATRKKPSASGWLVMGRVSAGAMVEFTTQLSTLQDAGLPIVRSLKVLWQQEKAGVLKNVLADVAAVVEEGSTLSEAMARHPRAFDRLYVNMVEAGETGGVLDVILERLAEFMDKAQRLRRRVIGAMVYPAAVISFSVLIVTGIMMFVIPRFQEIFRDFNTNLPALTVWLMGLSDFIANRFGWLLVVGAPMAVWGVFRAVGSFPGGRWFLDAVKLKLPVVGKIVSKVAVARFSRTLGTLLAAGGTDFGGDDDFAGHGGKRGV